MRGDRRTFPLGVLGFARRELLDPSEPYLTRDVPGDADAFSFALLQATGVGLEAGNLVDLVENGAIFEALDDAIRVATSSVHVLVYMWRPSLESDRLIEAIEERCRAGVRCRVLVDPVGSEQILGPGDFRAGPEQRLRAAGAEVRYFRPLAHRVLRRLVGRNHQKLAVIDGRIGFTGGFGVWRVWGGDGLSPGAWRDTHVRVEGPVVRQMQLAFAWAWVETGAPLLGPEEVPALEARGRARAGFVASVGNPGISDAERMTWLAIAAARRRLWIGNAYFSPPDAILDLLAAKARAGLDVRILVPGPIDDIPIVRAAQRWTYRRLLPAGVAIHEYQPSMLHEKVMLVDDALSVVGSTNLDAPSLRRLVEGSLVVAEPALAAALDRSFRADLARARRVGPADVRRGAPWRRVARALTLRAARV